LTARALRRRELLRFLKASRKPRRVFLSRGIVSLRPLAALLAFHLGRQLIERPRTESGYLLPDHLERHPDRALAALASNPRITLGVCTENSNPTVLVMKSAQDGV